MLKGAVIRSKMIVLGEELFKAEHADAIFKKP